MKLTEFLFEGRPALKLTELSYFDISQIFDCGQCFRFEPSVSPRHRADFSGVAHRKFLRIGQDTPDAVFLYGVTEEEFAESWQHYFALDAEYAEIRASLLASWEAALGRRDLVLERAMEVGAGIRLLRQEPWETLCSFILSQNNNIPRIKRLISALSERYGERIPAEEGCVYTFPTPERLADAGVEELFSLRTGFRAGYLYDAARRVSEKRLSFDELFSSPTERAAALLCEVKGVGPKVAACTLLFGFEKTDAFPVDVWMKRVMARYYPEGLSLASLGDYAGLAQQYLFYHERWEKDSAL